MKPSMPPIAANDIHQQKGSDDDSREPVAKKNTRSKLGRRGDPRMHRAVAARLANPNLTLLGALRIGGFEYPEDWDTGDDSTIIDKDNITLGQRKNQLSRRCRLARQAQQKTEAKAQSRRASRAASASMHNGGIPPISAGSQAALQNFMQHSTDAQGFGSLNPGLRRDLAMDEDIVDDVDMHEDVGQRMAKFHPQYHPLFVPPARLPGSAAPAASRSAAGPAGSWSGSSLAGPSLPRGSWLENALAQRQLYDGAPRPLPSQPPPPALAAASLAGSGTHPFLPPLNQGQNPPSGVAVASLNSTAGSVGMTLEQLALKLSAAPNLTNVLADQSNREMREHLALTLYRNECSTLYARCMLLSGYDPTEAQQTSPAYRQFCLRAWSSEGRRIQDQFGIISPPQPSSPPTTLPSESASETNNVPAMNLDEGAAARQDKGCFAGRHVHQLEGKCGHQAIIHQPDGAEPHVDFVVNGKVECYEGINPVGTSLWPSRYKCAQLSCDGTSTPHQVTCGEDSCENTCAAAPDPKELELSDVDFDGKEWNSVGTGGPDSILGLMGLAGSDDGRIRTDSTDREGGL